MTPMDVRSVETCIGGAGINNKSVYDTGSEMDAPSPEDTIIIWTGPFNGSIMPISSVGDGNINH